ncbi:leucine-rich repeat-containing protein 18 isoform X2 [Dunckerocampus dactyliophorus]|uniref:leucine-rich repeat-containing protein 18 isoform X2 n=1 Tax=Dunckerocampus dactyliophorus TaxID=161453 RepID=UPI0024066A62|nr:leucine-rich repeat-containing protein 18 isoform X2 [Dunckerocampus dactyliophorus]
MPKDKKGKKSKNKIFDLQMAQNCIELTPDGKQRLNLSFKQFSVVPNCIDKLCQLDELNLSRNLIKRLPDFIDAFNNIQILDLHSNYELGKLQNLRTLNLGLNMLQTLPTSIGELKELTYIGLSDNKFTRVPKCLELLQNLKKANLDRNPIPPPQPAVPVPKPPKMFYLVKACDLCEDCLNTCQTDKMMLVEALNRKEPPPTVHAARPETVT